MSYHCPSCQGILYDRHVTACAHCGAELPPASLFVPSEMPSSDKKTNGIDVPVELLARAWLDLRKARGNATATRRAVLRYFRDGFFSKFPLGLLLKWLLFWPNERESVLIQVGYSPREAKDFTAMVRQLTLQEVLTTYDDTPAATPTTLSDSNASTATACAEARAKVMWGETLSSVRAFLASKGTPPSEIDDRIAELNAERNKEVRRIGTRNVVAGLAILSAGTAIIYPLFRYFDSLTQVNRPIFFVLSVAVGLYGLWKLLRGLLWYFRPQAEHKAVSDLPG